MATQATALRKRGFNAVYEGQVSELPAPKRVEEAPVTWSPALFQQPPAALQPAPQPDMPSSRKRGLNSVYNDSELPAPTPKRVEQTPTAWPAIAQPLQQPTPFPAAGQPFPAVGQPFPSVVQPQAPGAAEPQGRQEQQQHGQQSFASAPAGALPMLVAAPAIPALSTPPAATLAAPPPAAPPAAATNGTLAPSPFTNPVSSCRDLVLAKSCHPDFAIPQLLATLSPAVRRQADGNFTIDANMLQRIGRRLTAEQQASLAGLWQFVVANYRHSFALGAQPGADGVVIEEPVVTIEEEEDEGQQKEGCAQSRQWQQQASQQPQQGPQQWQQVQAHHAPPLQHFQQVQHAQQHQQWSHPQQQWAHQQQQQQHQGVGVVDVPNTAAAAPMEVVSDTAAPMEE